MIRTLAAIFLALAASGAFAAPPAGADPNSPTARWYRSLKQPGTGMGCCDQSDCRPTHARRVGEAWEALSPDGWVPVPPGLVLAEEAHPGGSAVLCYLESIQRVLCFVPPMAGG